VASGPNYILLMVVMKTCLPPAIIQKTARSLQIYSELELLNRIKARGSGNYNQRWCQHLDQWSPAVAASINLFTLT